jgi:hypothetical protein
MPLLAEEKRFEFRGYCESDAADFFSFETSA